jgi:integrase/recombinase XerD
MNTPTSDATERDLSEPSSLASNLSPQQIAADTSTLRVSDAVEPFLLYCRVEKQYSVESQEKMREAFQSWLLRQFGELELTAIKTMHVLAFRQAMATKGLSIARQYSLLMVLKLFLKFCRTTLEINCLDPATVILPRRKAPQVEYLTNAEIQAIRESIDTFRTSGARLRALFETLLSTGMRISEVLSLNRDSIDFERKEAVIVGKGAKTRHVFFSEDALRWIRRYLGRREDSNPALFVTYGENPNRLSRGDTPRFLKVAGKLAGLKKRVTPHLLRHTFCTNLRNNGADISLIRELAGHQDIQTTVRYYLGTDKQVLKDAVAKYLNYGAPDAASTGS